MRKTILILIAFQINLFSVKSQCDCAESVETLISGMEKNYAGLKEKTKGDRGAIYKELCNAIRERSKQASYQNPNCLRLLQAYISFFEDKHTSLNSQVNLAKLISKEQDSLKRVTFFDFVEKINIDELTFKAYLDTRKIVDPIEGIYQDNESVYALMKDSENPLRNYVGFVLDKPSEYWQTGQVKFELKKNTKGTYTVFSYNKTHDLDLRSNVEIGKDSIVLFIEHRQKVYPVIHTSNVSQPKQRDNYWQNRSYEFSLKNLNEKTLILTIPSFRLTNKLVIDELLIENKDKLQRTPYLIIDLRNNGGGVDNTFYNIIPYLYTSPIASIGADILCSENTIAEFENNLEKYKDQLSSQEQKYYINLLSKMKLNIGKLIPLSDDGEFKLDKVYPFPQKIAIIVNRNSASSCEEFLLFAKQSSKVSILGENTSGTLDFSNVCGFYPPNMSWGLKYSSSVSRRLPHYSVDAEGIKPDVYLDPTSEWLAQTCKILGFE